MKATTTTSIDTLRCRARKIYFKDAETDFYIFLAEDLDRPRDAPKKVKGYFFNPRIYPGVEVEVRGEWERHPKYGATLVCQQSSPIHDSVEGRIKYMMALAPSLGELNASRILKALSGGLCQGGEDPFDAIDKDPQILYQVKGIPPALITLVAQEWREAREYGAVSSALMGMGIPQADVKKVFAELGADALQIITDNPYALALVEGISFKQADKIAINQGFSYDSDFRIASILEYLLEVAAKQSGHLYVDTQSIARMINQLPQSEGIPGFGRPLGDQDIKSALADRVEKGRVVQDDGGDKIYLAWNYQLEVDCAEMLTGLLAGHDLGADIDAFIKEYERIYKIGFSEEQGEAIRALNENKVLLLTGLPGTGKSTVSKALVRLFKQAGKKFMLMSPTGIAAKRLSTVVGEAAGTIHRSLGYSMDGEWDYNADNKLDVDAVLVDEVSMLDQDLFYRLLSALKRETILVLVGDHAQLPSVGAGNVLHEMIQSGVIKRVHLTQIFRQEGASDIILNAHRINRGEDLVISDPTDKDTDFRFVEMGDAGKITSSILRVVDKLFHSHSTSTYQVLSPTYKGPLGVTLLNEQVKELLNPVRYQQEIVLGGKHFREDDRVMVVANNYSLDVFNGEVGKIYQIDRKAKKIRVKIFDEPDDRLVDLTYDQARRMLMLAYAVTIHRVQGQEFDYIILPFHESFSIQLQRNLLYTAVTRAKKKVFIFGQWRALLRAIHNDEVMRRNTQFARRIQDIAGFV